jgi:ribosomal-protein-alanine N-acetyltransferase
MLVLSTERLRLRWAGPQDAAFMLALLNEPSWIANIGDRGVHSLEQAAAWIEARLVAPYRSQGFGFWLLERAADGERLGICGLTKRETLPDVDVGYALMPAFWGQGYAREAAAACLRYGSEVLGQKTILAITAPENAASARVLTAIGMSERGIEVLPGETRLTRVFAWQVAVPAPQ